MTTPDPPASLWRVDIRQPLFVPRAFDVREEAEDLVRCARQCGEEGVTMAEYRLVGECTWKPTAVWFEWKTGCGDVRGVDTAYRGKFCPGCGNRIKREEP